jgi:hypothetical protein
MAPLVGVAPNLRAVLAPHVSLQLMDWRALPPANDVERHRLMSIAAEAADFEIEVPRIQRVPQCRRRLRGTLVAEHALVSGFAGEPIRNLARLPGALRRCADRCAINALPRFGAHRARMRQRGRNRQAATLGLEIT